MYGVHKYTYVDSAVVIASCSDWTISYSSCCRNNAITSLSNGAGSSFYIQTTLNSTLSNCNSSPNFGFDPIFYTCIGDTAVYSHGVTEIDGDNLVFSLVNCLDDATTAVGYNTGFSGQNPLFTNYLQIDATTGTLKFVPTVAQVGVICMLVEEYRNGVKISEVIRDIQIGATNCGGNDVPIVSGINGVAGSGGGTGGNSITLSTGQNTCFTINALDVNSTQILEIQHTNSLSGATYTINPTGNTAQLTVCWTPTINDVGTHTFGVSVQDNACPIVAKKNYTYIINVQQGAMTIQGVITRSDGLPLSNSKIFIQNNFLNPFDSTTTDASGNYSITTTSNVAIKAVPNASHFDQKATYYLNAISYLAATPVTLNGQSSVTVDFSTLPALVKINGTVSRHDGSPLNNSWVHLLDTSKTSIDSVLTSAQGAYSFVVPDISIDYYIKATPNSNNNDQVITYYNGSETIQSADSIPILTTINIANFNTIDTASATGGKSIGGTVGVGTDNFTPYADVRLILKDNSGTFINDAITDDNGKFKFYGLSDGSYTIFVDKIGIDNELAPMVTLTAAQQSQDTLRLLLHSYYLEMLSANTTVKVLNVQNIAIYPNPIQTTLTIEYDLVASANINIDILDVNGRIVKNLKNERQNAGNHQHLEDISKNNFPNGIYFIRLQFDNQILTKKIIVKGQ
ncbi:MAG: T9SS type A sorting domain-containing protein [Saprospiraceae bacterium]|nr:T9SS type A sorting domain-containing protein [Saprospiraceae bacterium]